MLGGGNKEPKEPVHEAPAQPTRLPASEPVQKPQQESPAQTTKSPVTEPVQKPKQEKPVYFDGDGGKGLSLAVLEPAGKEFAEADKWILPLVQGTFNTIFTKYSAISVVDSQNLDKILAEQTEANSGNYSDDDYISIGKLTNARRILVGTITKTPEGTFMLEFSVTDVEAGNRLASYGPKPFSQLALQNFTAVQEASVDLLGQLGVNLTAVARKELSSESDARQVQSEIALSKGIEAAKQGTVVEALSYFFQAADYNPQSTEAASRLNIMSQNISSGNIGSDTRNDIQWRKQWIARIEECNQFVANYLKMPPDPSYLVGYSTDLKQGEIDYDRELVDISGLEINYNFPGGGIPAWIKQLQKVVNVVNDGLKSTGRAEVWKLSGVTPAEISGNFAYTFSVGLFTDKGLSLGTQDVQLKGSWTAGTVSGFSYKLDKSKEELTFTVDANEVSDTISVRFTKTNGKNTEQVASKDNISILIASEYQKEIERMFLSKYGKLVFKIGEPGPAGGIVFYDKGNFDDGWRYLECAPKDLGEAEWGASYISVSGTATGIGTGKKNTELIVAYLKQKGESGRAAQLCDNYILNGYADWFLPSKDELNLMYTKLQKQGLGGFQRDSYWSSSQANSNYARIQGFGNGSQYDGYKSSNYYVRCVWAF